jgi:hypothetical protein
MDDSSPEVPAEQVWERGFEGHELAQRLRMARLPLWEKLAWLEEAERVARHLRGLPAPGEEPPAG